MRTPAEIGGQVREAFAAAGKSGKFRPCAFFDERLDCIRVIARDCSVLETRINQTLTVLEDNYHSESGRDKYVGFTIKGARHFCGEHKLDLSTPIDISALLDALLAGFPDLAVEYFVNGIARPLVKHERIRRVEVPVTLRHPQTA